jgi:citrate synthase
MKEQISTELTSISRDHIRIRGYDVADLATRFSFGDLIYLLARGDLPGGDEGKLIEAMLVCCVDHGINTPSTQVARTVASCGSPLQAAIAAGVSALGDHHGGAGEALAHAMQSVLQAGPQSNLEQAASQVIASFRKEGRRVPGFGHRVHNPDPRAVLLLELADQWSLSGLYTALARAIERQLQTQTSRSLPINVDGALAALLSDLGFHWRYARAVFIIARTAGLAAQVNEELGHGKPMRFSIPVPVIYTGPADRSLPSIQEPGE